MARKFFAIIGALISGGQGIVILSASQVAHKFTMLYVRLEEEGIF